MLIPLYSYSALSGVGPVQTVGAIAEALVEALAAAGPLLAVLMLFVGAVVKRRRKRTTASLLEISGLLILAISVILLVSQMELFFSRVPQDDGTVHYVCPPAWHLCRSLIVVTGSMLFGAGYFWDALLAPRNNNGPQTEA